MRTPAQVRWDYIQQWLDKAEQDLRSAKVLKNATPEDDEVVAFHCQQSIEKFIKSLLVYHKIEFGKTHNLEKLRTLLKPTEPKLSEKLSIGDWLSPMAVEYRYPGFYEEITKEESTRLIPEAEEVKKIVFTHLEVYLKKGRP